MKLLLIVLLIFAAYVGVGWAVVTFAPVLDAGSTDAAAAGWAAGFAAPAVLLLVGWVVVRVRAVHRSGDAGEAKATLGAVKLGLLVLALPIFYVVATAADRRVADDRAAVLRRTGFTEAAVNRLGAFPAARDPFGGRAGGDGPVRRKLFVFDPDRHAASPLHFRLPARLRPAHPTDVGTVAHVAWVRGAGNEWQRSVRLIDTASATVVGRRWFPREGADAEVLRWLESLAQAERSQPVPQVATEVKR